MTNFIPNRPLVVEPPRGLYHWARIFNRLQRNFFVEPVQLRREKQIRDFIKLNGYTRVKFKTDTDVFNDITDVTRCDKSSEAELVVITDQKFSRYPCPVLIQQIKNQLDRCPQLYLCLNKHYINIDDSYHDQTLDENFNRAVSQWLKKQLPGYDIVDLSLDYVDHGIAFTWVIPDRHFFIRKL
jgi:hypothetical protein